jgi:hypothetical protein
MYFFASRADALRRVALWAVFAFPLVAGVVMGSTLYDGVRHLQFIYPVLVILAAAGWTGIFARPRVPWLREGAAAALAIGLVSALTFQIRFHPNQGVYFNALVGGPHGAFKRFDMDYWGNCMLQAVEWTAGMARSSGVPITISGNPLHVVQLNVERFSELYFVYPGRGKHYVYVRLARGSRLALRRLLAEPALHRVTTPDGAVLCTVTPGPAYGEFEALRRRAAALEANPHQAIPR